MDEVKSNNEEINSDANCSCEENDIENEDNNYPDYSYRKRVNYLYSEISGVKSFSVCSVVLKLSISLVCKDIF